MPAPKLDAPFYTDDELDALEKSNPVEALRIAREQAALARQLAAEVPAGARRGPRWKRRAGFSFATAGTWSSSRSRARRWSCA